MKIKFGILVRKRERTLMILGLHPNGSQRWLLFLQMVPILRYACMYTCIYVYMYLYTAPLKLKNISTRRRSHLNQGQTVQKRPERNMVCIICKIKSYHDTCRHI